MPGIDQQAFVLPVVSHDLRSTEAVYKILDSLAYLNQIADTVFTRVSNRIAENRTRIQRCSHRVDSSQAKIKAIIGSSKATTVLSPAKYPASTKLDNFKPLYHELDTQIPATIVYKLENNAADAGVGYDQKEPFALMQKTLRKQPNLNVHKDGLGRIPDELSSVSGLLLFNSSENPYKKYVSLDNLAGTDAKERERIKKEIASAPKSVLHGDALPHLGMVDFGFNPQLGPVPELNLPSVLPDLDGIADINWNESAMLTLPSIAPSQVLAALPALPSTVDMPISATPAPSNSSAPPPPPPPTTTTNAAPPPPPPPPPPVAANAPPPPPPPPVEGGGGAPPPPPAPVAAMDLPDVSGGGGGGGDGEGADEPPANDARGGLLADIRSFGQQKGKLRKAAERVMTENKEKKAAAGGGDSGGDMMGDLLKRLKMRRKGIGGKEGGDEDAPANPMAPPKAPASKPLPSIGDSAPIVPPSDLMANAANYAKHKEAEDEDDGEDWD